MTRASRLVAVAVSLLALPAVAQDRNWSAQVTPYLWGAGLSGSVAPLANGPTLEFDNDLSEVLEDLDAAFFITGFARRGRLVFLGDFSATTSSRDGTVPRVGLPVEGSVSQRSLTLAVGYRALVEPDWNPDVLAGLRLWWLEAKAKTPFPGLGADVDLNFADPIIAARTNIRLADDWSLIVYGDFGGFGVGSERTGQIAGTFNWQATDTLFLSAGYRQLAVRHEAGADRSIDAAFSAPSQV